MKRKKLCAIMSFGVVVLMTLSLLSVAGAGAQEGAPPVLPCSFYGNVSIDEEPAPVGTEITAKMDNKTCGNITVTEEGRYGGAGGFDPKLVVIGTAEDENKNVSFYVDGAKAEESATWHSGAPPKHFDLSVKKAAVGEGEGEAGSPGEGADTDTGALPFTDTLTVVAVVVVIAAALIVVRWRKKKS